MKRMMVILIICILTLTGCGSIDNRSNYETVVSTPTLTPIQILIPTPTLTPAPTPTPITNPLVNKYALYNQYYGDRDINFDEFIVKNSTAKDLENLLLTSGYYGVWFGCDDNNLDSPLEITSTLRNGKEYGIKLIYEIEGYIILYYYLDNPDIIYTDSFYGAEDGAIYLESTENDRYMNLTQAQYSQMYSEDDFIYEEGDSNYEYEEGNSNFNEIDDEYSESSLTEADIYFAGSQFLDQAIYDSSKLQKYAGYSYQIIGKKNAKEGIFGNTTLYASFGIKFANVFQEYTITIKMAYSNFSNEFEYRSCDVSSGYNDY